MVAPLKLTHRTFSTRRVSQPLYIKGSETKFVIGPDVFGGEDNSAIFQPIELKLSVCIGFIIPQVIYYVSSNVVDHGSNESTFTCFYCILCDNSFRTYVDMLRATFTWQPWRYFARLQSYFLLIMFVSSPPRQITQIISADLKIAVTLVVINIFWWNKKL